MICICPPIISWCARLPNTCCARPVKMPLMISFRGFQLVYAVPLCSRWTMPRSCWHLIQCYASLHFPCLPLFFSFHFFIWIKYWHKQNWFLYSPRIPENSARSSRDDELALDPSVAHPRRPYLSLPYVYNPAILWTKIYACSSMCSNAGPRLS